VKILVELPSWLGDTVMISPSIENLLKIFPNASFIFFGSKVSIELMRSHPRCIDSFVFDKNFLGFKKIVSKSKGTKIFLSYRGSFRSRLLKFFVKSNHKFQYRKTNFLSGHQVEKYNEFINKSFNTNYSAGELKIFKKNSKKTLNRKIIAINPGASYGQAKCWPPENFAEVAKTLSKEYKVILLGGNHDIKVAKQIIKDLVRFGVTNVKNYAGLTSIDELCSLIENATLFLTGDSGSMHIAAAYQVPTISIFGPTKLKETSQWRNKLSIVLKTNLECQPCMKRECPLGHHKCMRDIVPDKVLKEIAKLKI